MSEKEDIIQGVDLYERFREEDPEFIEEVEMVVPEVAILIGTCDTIEYTTSRNGKTELYRHEFEEHAKPKLVSSADGGALFLIGGEYDFTENGITDKE